MRFLMSSLIYMSCLSAAFAVDNSTEEFLKKFHENPQKMMEQLPPEIQDGRVIQRGFINYERLDRNLLEAKNKIRQDVMRHSEFAFTPFSAIKEDDNAAAMVDNGIVQANILELDRRGLASHALDYTLWSDTYWPIYLGLLSNRYTDGSNPRSKDWLTNYTAHMSVPAALVAPDNLSPAEKYDLLVGDTSMSLTDYNWNRGRTLYDQYNGTVASWMGICHGWSAATHMRAKIPFGSIVLTAANGQKIRFYQSDVKGLTSLLWANTPLPTRFLGNRCDITPPRDGQGRTVDDKCRDNNAGTVFLALANQLGINNRSFVMDATYDSQVWNYSVISYQSTYFNPQSLRQTDNIRQAIVPIKQYTIDKFKIYRSPNTAYVVGVTMDVTHLNETNPTHGVQTKPATLTKRYVMDLELDANYNIIGGEWYSRTHPDFLWTYSKDSQAVAPGDADINANDWDVKGPVPPEWSAAARKSSPKGMPLYSVIKKIVEAAPSTPPANSTADSEGGLDSSGTTPAP